MRAFRVLGTCVNAVDACGDEGSRAGSRRYRSVTVWTEAARGQDEAPYRRAKVPVSRQTPMNPLNGPPRILLLQDRM